MPNESQIDRIEQFYEDVRRLGGQSERTGILTNVIVIDAAPAGLTGRVIIQDPRDGDYIPALTVPGIVYANNDLVNVLFVEGTEPIAYQQGSQSSGSNVKVYQIWESDFGAVAWSTNATGDISAAGAYDITTTGDIFIGNATVSGNITLPNATAIIGSGSSNPDLGASASANRWGSIFLASSEIINALNSFDLTIGSIGTDVTMVRLTDSAQDVLDLGDVAGTGDVDIDFSNGQMFLEGSSGALAIGTTTTTYTFEGASTQTILTTIDADAANRRTITMSRTSDTAARGSQSAFLRARTTGGALQNGDIVGYFNFEGHDGTDYNLSAQFRATVDGAVSANTVPMSFSILTGATGSGGLSNRLHITSDGKVGINTSAIPHGGKGAAMLALDGANASVNGPHIQLSTASQDDPIFQILAYTSDNVNIALDAYFDGTDWRSGSANSNFRWRKSSVGLVFEADTSIAVGSVITWDEVARMRNSGDCSFGGQTTPRGQVDIDQSSTTAAQPVLVLDQADLSEEYIDFITASTGAGDPVDTVTAVGTTYARLRVAVNGTFKYLQLYNA